MQAFIKFDVESAAGRPSARAFFQDARDPLLYVSSPQTILETSRCSTFAFKSRTNFVVYTLAELTFDRGKQRSTIYDRVKRLDLKVQMKASESSTVAVLTEKPSVARDIARVLGADKRAKAISRETASGHLGDWASRFPCTTARNQSSMAAMAHGSVADPERGEAQKYSGISDFWRSSAERYRYQLSPQRYGVTGCARHWH